MRKKLSTVTKLRAGHSNIRFLGVARNFAFSPKGPPMLSALYLICTLYYPLVFPFLFPALTVEGYHVYFNCRCVYHNSTSARAEMSLMTVCYKKQSRAAQGSRSWGLWTGGHSELINNLSPPVSNTKQSSRSSVFDQSRRTPKRVELWFPESSFFLFFVPVFVLILNKLM